MLCLKVTRYFVYMWLPYLYTKEFGYSEAFAGSAASGFEIGGVFGSMLIGWLECRNSEESCVVSRVAFTA